MLPIYMLYKTKNLKSGEYYIGIHKTKWLDDDYLGSGARLRNAVFEQGRENFERLVLQTFEDRASAYAKEEELVATCLEDPLCYNVHTGGSGGAGRTISKPWPMPVQRALRELGKDIRNARLRRRIQTKLLAERAGISRTSLVKIEKGDPGCALGSMASVLHSLGLLRRVTELADNDTVGMTLQDEALPKRIRN
jgi:DNA-binding XRE family transcriptional regulator